MKIMKTLLVLLFVATTATLANAQTFDGHLAEWPHVDMYSVSSMQMGAYNSVAGSVATPPSASPAILRAPGGPGGPGTPNPFNPSKPPVRQDPIGDGLVPLLLLAAGYAIKRRR